jgi:hypothetical protein
MKTLPYTAALILLLSAFVAGAMVMVSAQNHSQQVFHGGGLIHGSVYGFTMYDELTPIEWAPVTASNDQFEFVAYTGAGGNYEMFVPTGTYNLTVITPGYTAYSMSVSVSDGSASTLNFYLEQSGVPIPEFQPSAFAVVLFIALASVLLAKRVAQRRRD